MEKDNKVFSVIKKRLIWFSGAVIVAALGWFFGIQLPKMLRKPDISMISYNVLRLYMKPEDPGNPNLFVLPVTITNNGDKVIFIRGVQLAMKFDDKWIKFDQAPLDSALDSISVPGDYMNIKLTPLINLDTLSSIQAESQVHGRFFFRSMENHHMDSAVSYPYSVIITDNFEKEYSMDFSGRPGIKAEPGVFSPHAGIKTYSK
jgi:hypothetical protein